MRFDSIDDALLTFRVVGAFPTPLITESFVEKIIETVRFSIQRLYVVLFGGNPARLKSQAGRRYPLNGCALFLTVIFLQNPPNPRLT